MFKNFYTTGMSANAKQLQIRFTKMRSGSGRFSRIMAVIMAVAILSALSCATIVMAAVGSDGLEHFDKNEVYFLRSISFNANISGKNVPDWVYEDVAGADGNINVTIRHYQMRKAVRGDIELHTILELSGTNGTTRLYSVNGGRINTAALKNDDGTLIRGGAVSSFKNPYVSSHRFEEAIEPGGLAEHTKPFIDNNILDADTGKEKCVEAEFGIDDKMTVQGIRLNFCFEEQSSRSKEEFDLIDANLDSLSTIGGDAETFFNTGWLSYFTEFEGNYKNTENADVNISVEKASPKEIVVNTNVVLENAKYIKISVLDKNGDVVSVSREDFSDKYTLVRDMHFNEDYSSTFNAGEKYRICIGVLDDNRNLIYRWQDYVTIK